MLNLFCWEMCFNGDTIRVSYSLKYCYYFPAKLCFLFSSCEWIKGQLNVGKRPPFIYLSFLFFYFIYFILLFSSGWIFLQRCGSWCDLVLVSNLDSSVGILSANSFVWSVGLTVCVGGTALCPSKLPRRGMQTGTTERATAPTLLSCSHDCD